MARQAESCGPMSSSMKRAIVRMCGLPSIREGVRRREVVGSTAHIPPVLCACRVCVQTLNTGLRLAQANCHRSSASFRGGVGWVCVCGEGGGAGFTLTEEQVLMLMRMFGDRVSGS